MTKGARGLIAIACLLLAAPAVAGNVYRCAGADGSHGYSSRRIPGADCTVVGRYSSHAARPARKTVAAAEKPSGPSAADAFAGSPSSVATPEPAPPVATPAVADSRPSDGPRRITGQVYSYVQDGVRHYTSARPSGSFSALKTIQYSYIETCYACGSRPGVNFGKVRLNTSAYGDEISAASKRYGVDEAVVRAIIHAESAFNPRALSRVGAQGLMQLMPATARRFGVGDAFDAAENIRGGVQYLAWLLKRFDGNVKLAAAGYNAGEGAVDKYKGIPPYAETRRYVERVGLLAARYRGTVAAR
jgi:soluble lytic murein transglycosylase-like protein